MLELHGFDVISFLAVPSRICKIFETEQGVPLGLLIHLYLFPELAFVDNCLVLGDFDCSDFNDFVIHCFGRVIGRIVAI